MKKVQSQRTEIKMKMNISKSFSGMAPQSFLYDIFAKIMFGRKRVEVKKSLLSPYFKLTKSSGFSSWFKSKKLDFLSKSSFS